MGEQVNALLIRGIRKRAAQFDLVIPDDEIDEIARWAVNATSKTGDKTVGMACIDYEILMRANLVPILDETKWNVAQRAAGDGDATGGGE